MVREEFQRLLLVSAPSINHNGGDTYVSVGCSLGLYEDGPP